MKQPQSKSQLKKTNKRTDTDTHSWCGKCLSKGQTDKYLLWRVWRQWRFTCLHEHTRNKSPQCCDILLSATCDTWPCVIRSNNQVSREGNILTSPRPNSLSVTGLQKEREEKLRQIRVKTHLCLIHTFMAFYVLFLSLLIGILWKWQNAFNFFFDDLSYSIYPAIKWQFPLVPQRVKGLIWYPFLDLYFSFQSPVEPSRMINYQKNNNNLLISRK